MDKPLEEEASLAEIEGATTTANEDISFQILRAIRRIVRRTSEYSRSVSRQSGVTVPQMLCLRAVADAAGSGITVAEIARAIHLSAANTSRILDRLEQQEFICRERSATDRRKVVVRLTASGAKKLQDLPQPLHRQVIDRLEKLGPNERIALLDALEKIVDLMDAGEIDAAPILTPAVNVSAESTT